MGEAATQWEYIVNEYALGGASMAGAQYNMNKLGALGWELVGVAGTDKTVGLNKLVAVFRRQLAPLPTPEDTKAGWQPDPLQRHQYRWWDGIRWTHKVADGNRQSDDPPTPAPMP